MGTLGGRRNIVNEGKLSWINQKNEILVPKYNGGKFWLSYN